MIKSRISLFLVGLSIAAVTIFEVTTVSKPALSKNCPAYNSSVVQAYRRKNLPTGRIFIKGGRENGGIRLYHSDAPNRIFGQWDSSAGEKYYLIYEGKDFNLGGDWGIQAYDKKGHVSCIYPVAQVGIAPGEVTYIDARMFGSTRKLHDGFNGPDWIVNYDDIWEGKKPEPQRGAE